LRAAAIVAYDDSLVTNGAAPLTGVDNVTGGRPALLLVAAGDVRFLVGRITDEVTGPFRR
jgi:hypothetical protein